MPTPLLNAPLDFMFFSTLQYRIGGTKICRECREFQKACAAFLYVLLGDENARLQAKSWKVHETFERLEASAKEGCDICRVWRKALVNKCHSDTEIKTLFASQEPVIMEPPYANERRKPLFVKILSPKSASVKLQDNFRGPVECKIERDALDEGIWQEAAEWLAECVSTHDSCVSRTATSFLPSRLVHIKEASVVRVCETIDLPMDTTEYIALSYVWGGDQTVKLTSERESTLKGDVPRQEFPRTIQDAFEVCRRLEVSYLWVDSLCILQDDGGADFYKESQTMDRIYGSATMTLVAASAEKADEGFLNDRVSEEYNVHQWRTNFAGHALSLQRKGITEVRARSAVASRGWCFQKELLSRRLLYCTSHGMFWACSKDKFAEHKGSQDEPYRNEDFEQHEAISSVLDPQFFISSTDGLHSWDRVIDQYSSRNVTRREDRLEAAYGIARSIEQQTNEFEDFILGMWVSRLRVQLLWITLELKEAHAHFGETKRVALNGKIPSWSWASTPPLQAVRMPGPEISYAKARLIDVVRDEVCLVLRGRRRPLLADHKRLDFWPMKGTARSSPRGIEETDLESDLWAYTKFEIFVREEGRDPVVIQCDRTPSVAHRELVCFEINYRGLLLLEHVSEDIYRRVGCCQLHNDAAFFAHAERDATIRLV